MPIRHRSAGTPSHCGTSDPWGVHFIRGICFPLHNTKLHLVLVVPFPPPGSTPSQYPSKLSRLPRDRNVLGRPFVHLFLEPLVVQHVPQNTVDDGQPL